MRHPLVILLPTIAIVAAGVFMGFLCGTVLNFIADSGRNPWFYAFLGGLVGLFQSIYLVWKSIQEGKKRRIIGKSNNIH